MSGGRLLEILRRLLLVAALAALAALVTDAPALAGKRVALVIGNSAYQNVPRLDNPTNDARLIARTLGALGFELVGGEAQVDLDKPRFDAALQSFSNEVQGAEVGLFYYAGHGLQVGGKNFLVPVEANPTKEADVYLQMIDTSIVLSQMEGAGTKLNIVLLDACRNNPFGGRGLRAAGGGLAQMQAPEGTLISYATQPGNVALDGLRGDSPYTTAVAETISRPGLGLFDAFNEVGLAVKRATGGAQQPWLASSPIEGGFYFAGPPPALAPTPSPAVVAQTPAAKQTPEPVHAGASVRDADRPAAPPTQTAALEGQVAMKPQTAGETPVAACDRLAAALTDSDRPDGVAGVEFKAIDPDPAVAACRAAIIAQPNNARFVFELARAVDKANGPNGEASALMRKAADAGYAAAMNGMGFSYEMGRGVTQDFAEALRWYRRGASAGNSAAMHRIGLAYEHGESVPASPGEAVRWYRKSAEAGDASAMAAVGRSYDNGFGVARNPVEAVRWFRKAADLGGPAGMERLGEAYLKGRGVARDPIEAVRWFRKAADAGSLLAMRNLGDAYKHGDGVAKDEAEAQRWFDKAQK
jgi:hypothetical protein